MKTIQIVCNYLISKFTTLTSSSIQYKILLIFMALAGFVFILLSTSLFGVGLSPDSVYYISTSRNFALGNGFVSYTGTPIVVWPPLYPILLSIPYILFNIDPLVAASFINAALFGLTVYFSGLILSRHLTSSVAYPILGTAVILLSNVLQDLYTMAWSETLFIFFIVLSLLYLEKYLEKKDKTSFIVFSLSVAFACLTRYIGICLVLGVSATLLFFLNEKFWARVIRIVIFVFISILPAGLWIIRNLIISGTLVGNRGPSAHSLIQNLEFTFDTVRDWGFFPPRGIAGSILLIIFIILLIGFIIGCIKKDNTIKLKARIIQIAPVVLFFVIYISFIIYSSTAYQFDTIDPRLLSPIFIPATILLLVLIDVLLEPFRGKFSPQIINRSLGIAMLIWLLIYPVKGIKRSTHNRMVGGTGGFNSIEWRKNSEIIQYLLLNPLEKGHLVYSNEADVLYILLNVNCQTNFVKIIPEPTGTIHKELQTLSEWKSTDYDFFIYFDKIDPRSYPYTKDQIQNSANVYKIIQVGDGAIFAVKRVP
jgi:hypothetical protein